MGIKKNLDETIINKLYDEIIRGEWTPGEQLSLEKIMDDYGVSRTPVIQALKKMSALGIVKYSSKGHFSVPAYTSEEIKDIIDTRILLEKYAIRKIESDNIKFDCRELYSLNEKFNEYTVEGKHVQAQRKDMELHKKIIEIANNKCVLSLYDRVQKQFMMVNYLMGRYTAESMRTSYEDHSSIIDALEGNNYDEAVKMCLKHVKMAYDKISERVDY